MMMKKHMDHGTFLCVLLRQLDLEIFAVADLKNITTPPDDNGKPFPRAISFAVVMNPLIMTGIRDGPTRKYADEYNRVNDLIDRITVSIETFIRDSGFSARGIPASARTDPVGIKGDFPHKTAATRAGLGWIGRNCLLITKRHGPWLRLGTVLTDLPLSCNTPLTRHYCGTCTRCVDACPANALAGASWHPGMPRKELIDVVKCDRWKKENYFEFNEGHNCGICAAVCPFGR